LLLDAGDFADNRATTGPATSAFLFKMHKRLGYDALTFGERELKIGPEQFKADEGPPVLMTNVYDGPGGDARPSAQQTLVRDVGGVTCGVFGLVDPQIGKRVEQSVPSFEFRDPVATTATVLEDFESKGVELVVLLSQLEQASLDTVLARFDAIDVVVLGASQTLRARNNEQLTELLMMPRRRGQGLAVANLTVNPQGEVVEKTEHAVEVGEKVADKPEILALVNEVDAEIQAVQREEQLAKQLEYQNRQKIDRFLGGEICARCHEAEHETWAEGPHAHAFQSLVELGMDAAPDCLPCHTVGYGEPTGFENPRIQPDLAGVQCESCHGMGSLHNMTDHVEVDSKTCTTCHDKANSPDFDLDSYMAQIRHW
jgi:hypothetical protein